MLWTHQERQGPNQNLNAVFGSHTLHGLCKVGAGRVDRGGRVLAFRSSDSASDTLNRPVVADLHDSRSHPAHSHTAHTSKLELPAKVCNPNPSKAVSGGQPNAHMRVRVPPPCVPSHAPLLLRDHPWMIAPLMCLCRLHTVAMCLRPVAMFECLTYVLYLTFALQGTIHGVHLPTPQPRTFCRSLHKAERDDCRAEMGSSQSHPSHPPPIPAHAPWDGTGAAIHSAGWWYAMLYRHGDVTARYNGQLISRVLT
jgi:hypothetical protein